MITSCIFFTHCVPRRCFVMLSDKWVHQVSIASYLSSSSCRLWLAAVIFSPNCRRSTPQSACHNKALQEKAVSLHQAGCYEVVRSILRTLDPDLKTSFLLRSPRVDLLPPLHHLSRRFPAGAAGAPCTSMDPWPDPTGFSFLLSPQLALDPDTRPPLQSQRGSTLEYRRDPVDETLSSSSICHLAVKEQEKVEGDAQHSGVAWPHTVYVFINPALSRHSVGRHFFLI
ncbi:uncharacterized protein LOC114800978 [Denticeps clupeoides]|uniref:uncharacterized protein LOC114800978 n=1 Tax=Denticeps clupeoides TaxID=299321 RepID=UPI0010A3DC1B|nr:uncharacterized protein LOC114800978 [Denticeps clupeoides]